MLVNLLKVQSNLIFHSKLILCAILKVIYYIASCVTQV